jgi:hypothetical protein
MRIESLGFLPRIHEERARLKIPVPSSPILGKSGNLEDPGKEELAADGW